MHFLLERLASSPQGLLPAPMPIGARPALGDLEALIMAQIQRLVANRPRDAQDANLLYSYGMPSVVELGRYSSSQLAAYAARLELMIRQTEPRLHNPQVRIVPAASGSNPNQLWISGEIGGPRERYPFRFAVKQDANA